MAEKWLRAQNSGHKLSVVSVVTAEVVSTGERGDEWRRGTVSRRQQRFVYLPKWLHWYDMGGKIKFPFSPLLLPSLSPCEIVPDSGGGDGLVSRLPSSYRAHFSHSEKSFSVSRRVRRESRCALPVCRHTRHIQTRFARTVRSPDTPTTWFQ